MLLPPAIMIQGVASNAGKSVLAAGLCRVLTRRGLNVAPFKAQNMSLNSWVTEDGGEMGIAQAMQARACGLAPAAAMNPVLLKPLGAAGSQIILLGAPIGIMPYKEYVRRKKSVWQTVKRAYAELAQGREAMILEGAGSPAEINLRAHDIVNMRMARHAGARVLLAADIDRGGAFAALAGTMTLLGRADRKLISAFILNKFRGDPSLLAPALERVCRRYKRSFVGIMPWLADLSLPDEDSVSLKDRLSSVAAPPGCVDIAIIDLPGMSNMSDWEPLLAEPRVHPRLVRNAVELGLPHAVIIPGSRNVPVAIAALRANGLFAALQNLAQKMRSQRRGQICGICAGLEILGEFVSDPHCLEGGGQHVGLGLLPLASSLAEHKCLARRKAIALQQICGAEIACHGQEIHHGEISARAQVCVHGEDGAPLAYCAENPAFVWGTWLHGIFDDDGFRHAWLNALGRQFCLGEPASARYDPDAALDRLADACEENLDMPFIMSLLAPQKHV